MYTIKIFTDNEYSHTIEELDFTPEIGDLVDRCYRVLTVTVVNTARPYIRLDCEIQ